MAAVLTRGAKIGNVLKKELWADAGWARKTLTVTVTADTIVGSVLEETSVAGKGTLVVTATAANASCVIIDETIYDLAVGDHDLVVLYAGPSIVAKNGLAYGVATEAAQTIAETALSALGIKVEGSVL